MSAVKAMSEGKALRTRQILFCAAMLSGLAASAPAADMPGKPTVIVAEPTKTADRDALADKLAELDAKIAHLEGRIDAKAPLKGTGAYARGTTLRIDGNGSESLLERLRRLEGELAASKAIAAVKDSTVATLTHDLEAARATGKQAREQADYLANTGESLQAAQQTLAERQEQIAALTAQAATSDLQRLRAERRWYALASEILRIVPEDTRDLPEIQARIRDATREVREGAGEGLK